MDLFLIASTNCTITFLSYKTLIILVDNNANRVHRKFPLDTCLICLTFFRQYDVIIRIGFRVILYTIVRFIWIPQLKT